MKHTIPPAISHNSSTVPFDKDRIVSKFEEMGVLETNEVIYTPKTRFSNRFILCPIKNPKLFKVDIEFPRPRRPKNIKYLKGTTLVLINIYPAYGHFLLETIGCLAIVKKAGIKLSDIDNFVMPRYNIPYNYEYLIEKSGIPLNKLSGGRSVKLETALIPTIPGSLANYPNWLADYLREQFLPPSLEHPYRRIYIVRSEEYLRNASNEEAVQNIMLKYGFELLDPQRTSQERVIKKCAEAAIVVGAQSSGMANIVFCKAGTKVLELMPTDHCHPYDYSLANAASLDYSCLMCTSSKHRGSLARGPSPYKYHVNEKELESTLEFLLNYW